MNEQTFTDEELSAYLDEMLSVDRMATVEHALRDSEPLRRRAASLARLRDHGEHSLGAIWRRRRLSCPSRTELGSYLLGTLPAQTSDYVDFHVRTVGCRVCTANLNDLEQAAQAGDESQQRRKKFFQSSAGYLHDREQR